MPPFLIKTAGWLLFTSFIIYILFGFNLKVPIVLAGSLTFIASILLFSRLIAILKFQVLLLFFTGLLLIFISDEGMVLIEKAITVNYALIALIISIGFLRLIIQSEKTNSTLPKGSATLWKTIGGAFIFTAVINLSAVTIFADRFSSKKLLDKNHIMILSRVFGANALWSPFFASMGVALFYSGGAELTILIKTGFLVAMTSLILTTLQCWFILKRDKTIFRGYPMHISSLSIPILLSILVIIAHSLFKTVSILILVSSVVMIVVLALLLIRQPRKIILIMKHYIEKDIVNSAGEILLFLSAGVLAVGITSFILTIDYTLPIAVFDGTNAAITLIFMVLVSMVGVHPIISISVVGSLLVPLSPAPNLLGLLFLFSWGLSIPLSSFSAISLLLQSRYKIKAIDLFKTNIGFTVLLLLLCCLILVLY